MSSDKTSLGDRMKAWERNTQDIHINDAYVICRVDGRAFHTLTRRMDADRPYDTDLMNAMDDVGIALCKEISGTVFAYVQSDEVSVVFTDTMRPETQMWFGGNLQKMVSITASVAAASWARSMVESPWNSAPWDVFATFDSRCFELPREEVPNYFVWRQRDTRRNSISMVAQSNFSQRQLHGKSSVEMEEMLREKGVDFGALPDGFRQGRLIRQRPVPAVREVTTRSGETDIIQFQRNEWHPSPGWNFTWKDIDELITRSV